MQVTPTPVPLPPVALNADAQAKTLPQVQAQAAVPQTRRAVDPSRKPDRGTESRSNKDRAKGGGQEGSSAPGGSVNIRV